MNTGGAGTNYSGAVCDWILEEQRPTTLWTGGVWIHFGSAGITCALEELAGNVRCKRVYRTTRGARTNSSGTECSWILEKQRALT